MKTCKMMQRIISAIASKHGVDLEKIGAHLRLEQDGYMPLSIETVGPGQIAVSHFFIQNGDLMYDPEIVFFVRPGDHAWVPLSITQAPVGVYREVLFFDDAGQATRYNQRGMADVASFAATWARNIMAQKWLSLAPKGEEG